MEPTPEMHEALEEARKMRAEMVRMALEIQSEDPTLARQLLDAASRTVSNLEDAIRCWEQMSEAELESDEAGDEWKRA